MKLILEAIKALFRRLERKFDGITKSNSSEIEKVSKKLSTVSNTASNALQTATRNKANITAMMPFVHTDVYKVTVLSPSSSGTTFETEIPPSNMVYIYQELYKNSNVTGLISLYLNDVWVDSVNFGSGSVGDIPESCIQIIRFRTGDTLVNTSFAYMGEIVAPPVLMGHKKFNEPITKIKIEYAGEVRSSVNGGIYLYYCPID